jgi:hypothetical protein
MRHPDDRTIQLIRDKAARAVPRVNARNDELPRLRLVAAVSGNLNTLHLAALNDALAVDTYCHFSVGRLRVEWNRVLRTTEHLTKSNGRPGRTHAPAPKAALMSRISSAICNSFLKMSSAS